MAMNTRLRHARDQAQRADDAGGDGHERGELNTCLAIWLPTSCSLPTRDTTIAAATEISSAGICATSASPMASRM